MAVISSEVFGNERVQIHVSEGGKFSATFDDQEYHADTLKDLREQLEKAAKEAREQKAVDVTVVGLVPYTKGQDVYGWSPFTDGIGVVHAKLRGKHKRESAWLLQAIENGKPGRRFKLSTYGEEKRSICRRLKAAEVEEYLRLANAIADAEAALEGWRAAMHVDPEEALKAGRS
jgi:hypothetical protein